MRGVGRKPLGKRGAQSGAAGARQCAQTDGADYTRLVAFDPRRESGRVDLVGQPDLRYLVRADLGQHGLDRNNLTVAIRVRGVDDVQQQVRLAGLGERCAERRRDRAANRG
jgi:hypothetical protein